MEQLSKKIAKKISLTLSYDEEREAVIAYGMIAIVQTIVTLLLILGLGLIFGILPEAFAVVLSASILRKYSGGSHAETIEVCTASAVVYGIGMGLVSRYLLQDVLNIYSMIAASVIVFAGAFWIIYKKAPVDSPNKPIRSEKKINRMRKGSFLVLSVYVLICIFLLIVSKYNILYMNIALCLLFGVIWQALTLTELGFKLSRVFSFNK